MSAAAKSVYYFGFYLLLAGLALFIAPNQILFLLKVPAATEIWIHLVGTLTFILGVFFLYMARQESRPFIYISMFGRVVFILGVLAVILIHDAPSALLLFAAVDAIGLIWTLAAWRSDNIAASH
jgi:hypothetical protein